jgi:hypothetical protein
MEYQKRRICRMLYCIIKIIKNIDIHANNDEAFRESCFEKVNLDNCELLFVNKKS